MKNLRGQTVPYRRYYRGSEGIGSTPAQAKGDAPQRSATAFVEQYQRGKSGIYPYRVAEMVAIEYRLPINAAIEIVSQHVRQVITAVCQEETP